MSLVQFTIGRTHNVRQTTAEGLMHEHITRLGMTYLLFKFYNVRVKS